MGEICHQLEIKKEPGMLGFHYQNSMQMVITLQTRDKQPKEVLLLSKPLSRVFRVDPDAVDEYWDSNRSGMLTT